VSAQQTVVYFGVRVVATVVDIIDNRDFLYFAAVLALAAVLAASPIVLLHFVQKTIPS